MKQKLLSLALAACMFLAGCGAPGQSAPAQSSPLPVAESSPASQSASSQQSASAPESEPAAESEPVESASGQPQLDLTQMGANMVYAVVYQMTLDPAAYAGQTVRVAGEYYSAPGPQKTYFFIYVSDAAACCSQGLEFVLEGDPLYPEDYPEEGARVVLTGTLETYTEEGDPSLYFRLRAAPQDLCPL